MNGEEKEFFTGLFSKHSQLLGRLEEGQSGIREDLGEVKAEQKEIRHRLDEKCADKVEVSEEIDEAIVKHYNSQHDPEKILGSTLIRNKERVWKIAFLIATTLLSLLGVSVVAGGV